MPIDYSKYPANWKTEIRPAILERADNRCEICNAVNGKAIFRGIYNGEEVYQYFDGNIHCALTGNYITTDTGGVEPLHGDETQQAIKVVLTISHLDHDITNNDYSNLKALCQKCHLKHDAKHHAANARETRNKKKGLQELF